MCDGMPASGRSGPANSRESTADKNVPVPGPPPQNQVASRVAVEKLRLDGTPTPRSLGGSDDEAAWHQPVRARAPPMRRPDEDQQ
jgi:hypothetical protein